MHSLSPHAHDLSDYNLKGKRTLHLSCCCCIMQNLKEKELMKEHKHDILQAELQEDMNIYMRISQ